MIKLKTKSKTFTCDGLIVEGMSVPSNINDDNILQYAKRTAKMINNPDKVVNKIIDLENIT